MQLILDLLSLAALLTPFAFLWCCCNVCEFCTGARGTTLYITFGGGWTGTDTLYKCDECANYSGNSFELTFDGDTSSSVCRYVGPGACGPHIIHAELAPDGMGGITCTVFIETTNDLEQHNGNVFEAVADCETVFSGTFTDTTGFSAPCDTSSATWQVN